MSAYSVILKDKSGNQLLPRTRMSLVEGLETAIAGKQGTLTAGTGISISNGVISTTLDTNIFSVVTALPTENISSNKIYVIKSSSEETGNTYDEYFYVNSAWEKIGSFRASVDLSAYAKSADVTTELAKKVDKVSGKGLSTNDYTSTEKTKLSGIATGAQVNVIESVKVNGTALAVSSKAVNIDLSSYATTEAMNSALSGKQDSLTIDTALSSTSTNPVQNKVINTALAGKQATISDLATIRTNASTGAGLATQVNTNKTDIAAAVFYTKGDEVTALS